MGYLGYVSEAQNCRLGFKGLSSGKAYEQSYNLTSLCRPIMRILADQTSKSGSLSVVDNLQRLCLARDEETFSIRYNTLEGQRMVLYAGQAAKSRWLSGQGIALESAFQRPPPEIDSATIQNPKRLEKELETVGRQGYVSNYG